MIFTSSNRTIFFPSRYLSEENMHLQWSKRNHNQILFCMLIAYTQIERDIQCTESSSKVGIAVNSDAFH